VGDEGWEKICREMEALLRQGKFEEAVLHGIRAVSAQLTRHYPPRRGDQNELDDRPVKL
jgi:uncharacterized membrane protein